MGEAGRIREAAFMGEPKQGASGNPPQKLRPISRVKAGESTRNGVHDCASPRRSMVLKSAKLGAIVRSIALGKLIEFGRPAASSGGFSMSGHGSNGLRTRGDPAVDR